MFSRLQNEFDVKPLCNGFPLIAVFVSIFSYRNYIVLYAIFDTICICSQFYQYLFHKGGKGLQCFYPLPSAMHIVKRFAYALLAVMCDSRLLINCLRIRYIFRYLSLPLMEAVVYSQITSSQKKRVNTRLLEA